VRCRPAAGALPAAPPAAAPPWAAATVLQRQGGAPRRRRDKIKLWLGYVVKKVEFGVLTLEQKRTGEQISVPFGVCVWCTGIKLNPLCEGLIHALPAGSQDNMRSLTTDNHLRVKACSPPRLVPAGAAPTSPTADCACSAPALHAGLQRLDLRAG